LGYRAIGLSAYWGIGLLAVGLQPSLAEAPGQESISGAAATEMIRLPARMPTLPLAVEIKVGSTYGNVK